nr:NAD(P)/FAD-dependent oxidoreductase [Planobispora longispora]
MDARLSRYSYLVSLLPSKIVKDLGLGVELRRRRYASYTPVGGTGLLVDNDDAARTAASFARVTGGTADLDAWRRFYAMTARVAAAVAPTLLEPLADRTAMRGLVGREAWRELFERPIGEVVDERFADDTVRGVVLTDALIGTFADPCGDDLLANRCFLYHVIGDGTGDWNVPVGGMGAVSGALADAARAAGAEIATGAEAVAVDPSGEVVFRDAAGEHAVTGERVLANVPPAVLARLLGAEETVPEGAQLKVNMVLSRLPRLKDPDVDPAAAFSGTFHINEGRDQLARAHAEAARGDPGSAPGRGLLPLADGPVDPGAGPARGRGADDDAVRPAHARPPVPRRPRRLPREALRATLASMEAVLAEPIEDCLLRAPDGSLCLEAKTPVDLEDEAGLPGGHIFHRDLSWPFGEPGAWGVETGHERILLCGAGARRGGGVSGIPGHNAAMAVLGGA